MAPGMEPRIDCHMLTQGEPQAWMDECLASLAGAPITLHVVADYPAPMGPARTHAFRLGTLPYVSSVDPDNRYEPAAFTALADALDAQPAAMMAYTDEATLSESGRVLARRHLAYSPWQHAHRPDLVHSLILMRRSAMDVVVDDISDMDTFYDWMLSLRLAQMGPVIHLPIVGRYWRQHPGQAHLRNHSRDADRIRAWQAQTGHL